MTALELADRELRGADWQWRIVEIGMFAHATLPDCRGWTMGSSGKAWCGQCGWEIAARLDESRGAATFAMIALARIGEVFTMIGQLATQHAMLHVGAKARDAWITPDGVLHFTMTIELHQVSFTHTVEL